MAETTLSVNNSGVIRFRLEPTDINAPGNSVSPILRLQFKAQLSALQNNINYTIIRIGGRLTIGTTDEHLAFFEAPPLMEESINQAYEHHISIDVALGIREAKRVEDIRNGNNPHIRIRLIALVFIAEKDEFQCTSEASLDLIIPRSHWIDNVLNVWKFSDLFLLEINLPSTMKQEFNVARERLAKAEQLFKIGEYTQVLSTLRSAFEAIAVAYGSSRADKNLFTKILANVHPEIRDKMRDSISCVYDLLNSGPHEPTPTTGQQQTIGCEEARYALISTYAIFECFSRYNWPGL